LLHSADSPSSGSGGSSFSLSGWGLSIGDGSSCKRDTKVSYDSFEFSECESMTSFGARVSRQGKLVQSRVVDDEDATATLRE